RRPSSTKLGEILRLAPDERLGDWAAERAPDFVPRGTVIVVERDTIDGRKGCDVNPPLTARDAVHLKLGQFQGRRFGDAVPTPRTDDEQPVCRHRFWGHPELIREV